MKVRIIVKGNEETILECAIRRGIRVLEYQDVSPCMSALVEVEDTETLMRWYAESDSPPFPEGSLLYWTLPKSDEKPFLKDTDKKPLLVSAISGFLDHFKDMYDFTRLEIRECLEENRRSDVSLIKKAGNTGIIVLHVFLFPVFIGFWIGLIGLLIATILTILALLFGVDQRDMPGWMQMVIELSRRR